MIVSRNKEEIMLLRERLKVMKNISINAMSNVDDIDFD